MSGPLESVPFSVPDDIDFCDELDPAEAPKPRKSIFAPDDSAFPLPQASPKVETPKPTVVRPAPSSEWPKPKPKPAQPPKPAEPPKVEPPKPVEAPTPPKDAVPKAEAPKAGADDDFPEDERKRLAKRARGSVTAAVRKANSVEDDVPLSRAAAKKVSWAAAFALFAKGFTLDEIAEQMGESRTAVNRRAREEDWAATAHLLVVPSTIAPPSNAIKKASMEAAERVQERIIANRERAYSVSERLRGKIEDILASSDSSGRHMDPKDVLTLARAARLIDESTMLALGDSNQIQASSQAAKGGAGTLPAITINIPSFVSPKALESVGNELAGVAAAIGPTERGLMNAVRRIGVAPMPDGAVFEAEVFE